MQDAAARRGRRSARAHPEPGQRRRLHRAGAVADDDLVRHVGGRPGSRGAEGQRGREQAEAQQCKAQRLPVAMSGLYPHAPLAPQACVVRP